MHCVHVTARCTEICIKHVAVEGDIGLRGLELGANKFFSLCDNSIPSHRQSYYRHV